MKTFEWIAVALLVLFVLVLTAAALYDPEAEAQREARELYDAACRQAYVRSGQRCPPFEEK